jgi:hypothetical protein
LKSGAVFGEERFEYLQETLKIASSSFQSDLVTAVVPDRERPSGTIVPGRHPGPSCV